MPFSMSAQRKRSRSSSTTPSVLFATAGDLRRVTGGNVYARHMLAALRRAGLGVSVLDIEGRRGSELLIKRLQKHSDGSLSLLSDNPTYAPERLPRDEADELEVIGRVAVVLRSI